MRQACSQTAPIARNNDWRVLRRKTVIAAILGVTASGMAQQASSTAHVTSGQSAFEACARPDVAPLLREAYGDLGGWPAGAKLPVVYSSRYNIGFYGLENLHPFDSKKYQHVLALLEARGVVRAGRVVKAREASHAVLREVHSEAYLQRLNSSPLYVAQVTELAPLSLLPSFLLRSKVLRPMATMAGGTMLAAALAVEHGWSINLGGGMHHAAVDSGGGWCTYADIHLAMRRVRAASGGRIRGVMVVDLDAHQGNGIERCKQHFREEGETFIVDVYNASIYPWDRQAKQAIDVVREVRPGAGDEEYLAAVRSALEEAFQRCHPDLLIFNAGTDILAGDPLGRLDVSSEVVVRRDEMVWQAALEHRVPIVQVLSGGYTKASTPCIAGSIENLFRAFNLGQTGATG